MRPIVVLLVAFLAYAAPPQNRIRAVENGLMPSRVLKGRPRPHYTIEERMSKYNVRGVSIAVINNYEIDWAKGYGVADLESKRPVTKETLFQAGSISKPVAAVAALKLMQQKKLSLDEDVNAKLRSWKVPDNDLTKEQKVTLRRILSHSAGLTVHGFPGYESGKPVPSVPDILDGKPPANTPAVRVDLLPGTRFRYSGGGYTVMQLLLGDVAGRGFPELVNDLVLKPAGMKHSTYRQPLPPKQAAMAASAYRPDGGPVPGRFHVYPEMAAAGLWTTASDLARFAIEIQKSREGRSNRILSKPTVEEMLREQMKPYGLGFSLEETGGLRKFGHGGADEGFQALLMATFDGRGFAIMVNSDNGIRLANEIAQSIAAEYHWPDKPVELEAVTLPREQLERMAGRYKAPAVGVVTVRVDGDHLRLSAPRIGETEMYPETNSKFFSLETGLPALTFTLPADGGAATGFQGGGLRAERIP